ncbi:unnamed protein product [Heligmosomoides polygyrus]|uniref:Reverse transcriptase domain-containing protein n=1 Tax=Heligmosomoides polygyrus TaxID=6339 RepID=A0A183FRS4_HELPZ|nr:unnamed protein product [Heligmosomoides polygyrus]
MVQYKLTYFEGRGSAEIIRQCDPFLGQVLIYVTAQLKPLFALGGQDYEDVRLSMEEWPKHKAGSATLKNVMRELEWEAMGVKVNGRQLHHLPFADDIVLVTPSISQAERMLADFDRVCGNVGLQLNLTKTMFMRNGQVSDAPFSLNGTNISERLSC